MAGKSKRRERDTRPGAATSKWEWVAGAVGLVLVLGAIGYIAFNALTTEPSVPAVTVEHVGTERNDGGYVVKFRARNSRPSTAASLTISGTLHDGATEIESSEVTLDYLPPRGERKGGLIFQADPAVHDLRLEAEGYVDP
jgi:uncharacterized protein (TIGR02588 family)